MRVRLLTSFSGTRNGEPWPAVGEIIDLPDGEARDMITVRYAEPVDAQSATARVVENGDADEHARAEDGDGRGDGDGDGDGASGDENRSDDPGEPAPNIDAAVPVRPRRQARKR